LSVPRSGLIVCDPGDSRQDAESFTFLERSTPMAKRGRKRRAGKKKAANHGKRPNA
jgi:hypothetical protein